MKVYIIYDFELFYTAAGRAIFILSRISLKKKKKNTNGYFYYVNNNCWLNLQYSRKWFVYVFIEFHSDVYPFTIHYYFMFELDLYEPLIEMIFNKYTIV